MFLQDWSYPMRREMQEIIPKLFLGPYSAAMKSKLPTLERHGITHIICVRQDSILYNYIINFIKSRPYLTYNVVAAVFPQFSATLSYIADNPVENIIRYFPVVSYRKSSLICIIFIGFRSVCCV
uniref:Serine/threonine/tyrosine-interacting protein-like n=1 Tax=Scleropages formosus TaxID=113540 RepID=A0A8C9RKJ4_SCLFO